VSYLFRSGNATSKMLAENIVRQWKQNLNLDIPLEQVELKIANQQIKQKNYSIAVSDWIGDYDDPSTFTDKYLSTSVNNDSGWTRPQYDTLVHAAATEPDPQKRLRLLEKAERMIDQQLPIIPLYHLTNQELFRRNVKGINTNPRNMTMFKAVEVMN
jgi:oligopeptide transport system substrate-binding protein